LESRVIPVTVLGHTLLDRERPTDAGSTYLCHPTRDAWHSSNNGAASGRKVDNYFVLDRLDNIRDYIVLLSSNKGGPHFRSPVVSRWPIESDWYRKPEGTFYLVGRYLLFEVLQPTPNVRLRISLSTSLMGWGRTALPTETLLEGAIPEKIPFLGSGAANVISDPIRLFERNGHFYFALDFQTDGVAFPNRKTGLMRLFNVQIPVDRRHGIGFSRDISLVTESAYQNLSRPRTITLWPGDLLQGPGTEFSGIYEDGWISDRAFITLGNSGAGETLVIKGELPAMKAFDSGSDARIILNGKPIYVGRLMPGNFKIEHTITERTAENRLDFFFSQMARLPSGDDRPVSAKLSTVAIVDHSAAQVGASQALK